MGVVKKLFNALGILVAWLLSIVLVIMLVATPIVFSALSLLDGKMLTKAFDEIITSIGTMGDKGAAGEAEDYGFVKLSETSENVEIAADLPIGNISIGDLSLDNIPVGNMSEMISGALEGVVGDALPKEAVDAILSSNAAQELFGTFTEDVVNAISGSDTEAQFNAETIKGVINDNMDEIIGIIQTANPELLDVDIEQIKSTIQTFLDENVDKIMDALPKPRDIVMQMVEESPELEMAMKIIAAKDTIKLAIIGVIVALSLLIFIFRLFGMKGFLWLAVDLFIAGGIGLVPSLVLTFGASVVRELLAESAILSTLVNTILSGLATGMLVRVLIVLACAGCLLTIHILIKKARAKKRLKKENEGVENVEMLDVKAQKYDIIILAGQSNARGQGLGDVTKEWVPDERIHHMTDDANAKFVREDGIVKLKMKWPAVNSVDLAEERVDADGNKLGSFGFWFAKQYADTYLAPDRKVLIVGANFGGTGFARPEWGVGNIMHTRMITMIEEALSYNSENRIVAFLWHQGEHDSFENADWDPEKRYSVHKENVRATFADFYKQVGDNTIPIIAGGFSNEYYLTNQVACDAVLTAIRECCAEVGGGFVETDDLQSNNQRTGNEDEYHFCREALRILGERYFDEYVRLIHR